MAHGVPDRVVDEGDPSRTVKVRLCMDRIAVRAAGCLRAMMIIRQRFGNDTDVEALQYAQMKVPITEHGVLFPERSHRIEGGTTKEKRNGRKPVFYGQIHQRNCA